MVLNRVLQGRRLRLTVLKQEPEVGKEIRGGVPLHVLTRARGARFLITHRADCQNHLMNVLHVAFHVLLDEQHIASFATVKLRGRQT